MHPKWWENTFPILQYCTRYTALCTVYSTIQYSIPAVLPKFLQEENKYTEIANGAKSKYRFITKHREILESYQNTYYSTGEPKQYTEIPTGGCHQSLL